MPTANDHIKRSLYLIGASSPIKPASPEILAECLVTFNDMVEQWSSIGYEVYLTKAATLGSEVYNEEWASPVIQYTLAVMCAPICQVDVPPAVAARQMELMTQLQRTTRLNALDPDRVKADSRLPVGSGVDRGRYDDRRFFGVPNDD